MVAYKILYRMSFLIEHKYLFINERGRKGKREKGGREGRFREGIIIFL